MNRTPEKIQSLNEDNTVEEKEEMITEYSLTYYNAPNTVGDHKNLEENSMEDVVKAWLEEIKEGKNVAITAQKSDADDLIEWARDNKELILEMIEETGAKERINVNVFMEELKEAGTDHFIIGAREDVTPFDL